MSRPRRSGSGDRASTLSSTWTESISAMLLASSIWPTVTLHRPMAPTRPSRLSCSSARTLVASGRSRIRCMKLVEIEAVDAERREAALAGVSADAWRGRPAPSVRRAGSGRLSCRRARAIGRRARPRARERSGARCARARRRRSSRRPRCRKTRCRRRAPREGRPSRAAHRDQAPWRAACSRDPSSGQDGRRSRASWRPSS